MDIKKWEEEQMRIATVRFGAKDAKERNKVGVINITGSSLYLLLASSRVCILPSLGVVIPCSKQNTTS